MKSNLERHVEQFFAASGASPRQDHTATRCTVAQCDTLCIGRQRQTVAELAIEALAHATTLLATVAEIATVEQLI